MAGDEASLAIAWKCWCFAKSSYSAPNFTPTNLTVLHKNATSITISWTAVDATDADGYVVYYNTTTGPDDSAVDVGDVTQYTLGRLQVFDTYNISIRAYQDLLGPATMPLIVTIQGKTLIQLLFEA